MFSNLTLRNRGFQVADSDALRVRRSRAHKAGDHSLCRRCPAVKPALASFPPGLQTAEVADAEAELRRLAARLVAAHEHEPSNAILARELRMTLEALMAAADTEKPDADLTGLFGALQA
jgi:hypothetical protein